MVDYSLPTMLFLGTAGFLASFIDSVVGGGGLIGTPALMATGIPVPYALGTGKINIIGTITSFYTFFSSGKVDKQILRFMPISMLAGALGALTVNAIPEHIMRYIVVISLVIVAVYTFFRKDWGNAEREVLFSGQKKGLLALAAAVLGYYGFFGPGTGTFLIFVFLTFGFDFVRSAGNAKALNLSSNIGSLIVFIATGKVILLYALVMGFMQVIGARAGAKIAITKGARFVRPLFLVITTLLISKQVYELFLK